jgi:hypothetical protein
MRTTTLLVLLAMSSACRSGGGAPPVAQPAAATAAPGERPQTKEACDACHGLWEKHGLAQVEGCLCRMQDAGKPCRDGGECKGQCVADEGHFKVVETSTPPKGYFEGRCSEYDTTFGCHRFIPTGARGKPPQTEEEAADQLCVD